MPQRPRSHYALLGALAVVALSTVTSFVTQNVFRAHGAAPSEGRMFVTHLVVWSISALALFGVLAARDRLRAAAASRSRRLILLIEVLCPTAYALVVGLIGRSVLESLVGTPPFPPGMEDSFRPLILLRGLAIYGIALLVLTTVRSVADRRRQERESRERALREELLEAQLSTAQLEALRAQVHPHFLFNSLHAIGGLILDGESGSAHRALVSLSSLLRSSFRHDEGPTVPVEREVDLIREYVALERIRLGERLDVRFDIPQEANDVQVPSLVLLPLVENAIRHGIAPLKHGGSLLIACEVNRDHIELSVTDNGVGFRPGEELREGGIGLRNSTERLRNLYGDRGRLGVVSLEDGGTQATVRVPRDRARVPSEVPA